MADSRVPMSSWKNDGLSHSFSNAVQVDLFLARRVLQFAKTFMKRDGRSRLTAATQTFFSKPLVDGVGPSCQSLPRLLCPFSRATATVGRHIPGGQSTAVRRTAKFGRQARQGADPAQL